MPGCNSLLCAALGDPAPSSTISSSNRSGSRSLQHGCQRVLSAIKQIQQRLWDLLPIIRNDVYHPAFAGSYSLRAVLPALVPEMTHEGMPVANGQDAGLAWESLVRGDVDGLDHERVRKA